MSKNTHLTKMLRPLRVFSIFALSWATVVTELGARDLDPHGPHDYTGRWIITAQNAPSNNLEEIFATQGEDLFPRISFSRQNVFRIEVVEMKDVPLINSFKIMSEEGYKTHFVWDAAPIVDGVNHPGYYVQSHDSKKTDPDGLVLEDRELNHTKWSPDMMATKYWPCEGDKITACLVKNHARCEAEFAVAKKQFREQHYEQESSTNMRKAYAGSWPDPIVSWAKTLFEDPKYDMPKRAYDQCRGLDVPPLYVPPKRPSSAKIDQQPEESIFRAAAYDEKRIRKNTRGVAGDIIQRIIPISANTIKWQSVTIDGAGRHRLNAELLLSRVPEPVSQRTVSGDTGLKSFDSLFTDRPRSADLFYGYDLRSLTQQSIQSNPGTPQSEMTDYELQSFSGQLIFKFPTPDSYYYKTAQNANRIILLPLGTGYSAFSSSQDHSYATTLDSSIERHDASTIGFGADIDALFVSEKVNLTLENEERTSRANKTRSVHGRKMITSHAMYLDMANIELRRPFIDDLESMAEGGDYGMTAQNFIDKWGTHYARGVVYGAICWMDGKLSAQSDQRYQSSSIDLSVELSGSFEGVGGGVSADVKKSKSLNVGRGVEVEDTTYGSIGAVNNSGSCVSDPNNEAPISVDLRPIHELINPVLISDEEIYSRAKVKLQAWFAEASSQGRQRIIDLGSSFPRYYDVSYEVINNKPGGFQPNDTSYKYSNETNLLTTPQNGFSFVGEPRIAIPGDDVPFRKIITGTLRVDGHAFCDSHSVAHPNQPSRKMHDIFWDASDEGKEKFPDQFGLSFYFGRFSKQSFILVEEREASKQISPKEQCYGYLPTLYQSSD